MINDFTIEKNSPTNKKEEYEHKFAVLLFIERKKIDQERMPNIFCNFISKK